MVKRHQKEYLYISRVKAAEKLKISLSDFTELCILTNTKPRNAKTRLKYDHEDKIFYLIEDIQKLLDNHSFETLLRRNWLQGKKLEHLKNNNEEKSNNLKVLDHSYIQLVRDRFNTFQDAIIHLNESLNIIFMVINMFQELDCFNGGAVIKEWKDFCKKRVVIDKVFVSSKGFYYFGKIKGIEILWLEPFSLNDECKFDTSELQILYKFSYYHIKSVLKTLDGMEIESRDNSIFSGKRFYLNQKNEHVEYLINIMGGNLCDMPENIDFYITSSDVNDFDPYLVYVQPQYIFDCFNEKSILDVKIYLLGKVLPEHKCPFVRDEKFKFDKDLLNLVSKTKQRKIEEILKESKY